MINIEEYWNGDKYVCNNCVNWSRDAQDFERHLQRHFDLPDEYKSYCLYQYTHKKQYKIFDSGMCWMECEPVKSPNKMAHCCNNHRFTKKCWNRHM